jgi:deoxyribodipyrimidine photolyase-related protein
VDALQATGCAALHVTEPGEYRLLAAMQDWESRARRTRGQSVEDRRFLASTKTLNDWARGRKQLRMEYFYREMRKALQPAAGRGG